MQGQTRRVSCLASLVMLLAVALVAAGCTSHQWVPCQDTSCPNCRGTGTYRCLTCMGRGQDRCTAFGCNFGHVQCTSCNGSGMYLGKRCWGCSGAGRTNCYTCGGNGTASCSNCGGSGMQRCERGHWVTLGEENRAARPPSPAPVTTAPPESSPPSSAASTTPSGPAASSTAKPFCADCGAKFPNDGSRFCPSCGKAR